MVNHTVWEKRYTEDHEWVELDADGVHGKCNDNALPSFSMKKLDPTFTCKPNKLMC